MSSDMQFAPSGKNEGDNLISGLGKAKSNQQNEQ